MMRTIRMFLCQVCWPFYSTSFLSVQPRKIQSLLSCQTNRRKLVVWVLTHWNHHFERVGVLLCRGLLPHSRWERVVQGTNLVQSCVQQRRLTSLGYGLNSDILWFCIWSQFCGLYRWVFTVVLGKKFTRSLCSYDKLITWNGYHFFSIVTISSDNRQLPNGSRWSFLVTYSSMSIIQTKWIAFSNF